MFAGQAFIQLLVLVLLADTIEYGQWKLGKRTESVLFSVNPFITKLASSIQVGLTSLTLVLSGLNNVSSHIADMERELDPAQMTDTVRQYIDSAVTSGMDLFLSLAMSALPLLLIAASYLVFMLKYKIDRKKFEEIIGDLKTKEIK